tara:strand:- start:246 stop:644 length:399 start_codon:yes stop_codon:yes gene_type:complete
MASSPGAWEELDIHQILVIQSEDKPAFFDELISLQGWLLVQPAHITAHAITKSAKALIGTRRLVPGIIIDIPREPTKQNANRIATAIECLKDGEVFDTRTYKGHVFEPCPIIVCTRWPLDREIFPAHKWILR